MASRRTNHGRRGMPRPSMRVRPKGGFVEEWGWLLLLAVLTAALVSLVALTDIRIPHSPLLPGR